MNDLDIASYNFRGLQTELKRRKIFNFLHNKGHDIVLLQETHSVKKNEKVWKNEWGGDIVFSHYIIHEPGVSPFSSKRVLITKLIIKKFLSLGDILL